MNRWIDLLVIAAPILLAGCGTDGRRDSAEAQPPDRRPPAQELPLAEQLIRKLSDEDHGVRETATREIIRMGRYAAPVAMLDDLSANSPDPDVRARVALILWELWPRMDPEKETAMLDLMTRSPNLFLDHAAVAGIVEQGENCVPRLIDCLNEHGFRQDNAVYLLELLTEEDLFPPDRREVDEEYVQRWRDWLRANWNKPRTEWLKNSLRQVRKKLPNADNLDLYLPRLLDAVADSLTFHPRLWQLKEEAAIVGAGRYVIPLLLARLADETPCVCSRKLGLYLRAVGGGTQPRPRICDSALMLLQKIAAQEFGPLTTDAEGNAKVRAGWQTWWDARREEWSGDPKRGDILALKDMPQMLKEFLGPGFRYERIMAELKRLGADGDLEK